MTKPNEERLTIFYSWQTDLPDEDNRRLIRSALREAVSLLERSSSYDNLVITIDEATRGEAGSPNIPMTILKKIRQADIFISDITTINRDAPDRQRRVPNPNVIFELGYAVAYLGWSRIIMLFNTSYGDISKDAPFDIDRQRVSSYNYTKPSVPDRKSKATYQALAKLLFDALKIIIDKKPIRAELENKLTEQEKKRQQDLTNLIWLLSEINVPAIERHCGEAPYKIYDEIFYYWESFHNVYSSSLFYLYDSRLRALVKAFHDPWDKSLSYGEYYYSARKADVLFFVQPLNRLPTKREELAWKAILKSVKKQRKALDALLNYIRENYIEVNIDELSHSARRRYIDFLRTLKKKFKI